MKDHTRCLSGEDLSGQRCCGRNEPVCRAPQATPGYWNKGEGVVGGKVGEVAGPGNESFVGCRKDYGACLKYQMLKGFD